MREIFLHLVRLGIGHCSYYTSFQDVDWESLRALAAKQGLSAIVLDGLDVEIAAHVRNEGIDMPQRLRLEWIGEVMQNCEARYADYEKAIKDLAGFYSSLHIKMMVLKGYGLSLNYPKPNHRPCGDIDIWNFGKQKEADDWMTKECGIKVDTSEHHHTVFWWKDYMVENHYDFLS